MIKGLLNKVKEVDEIAYYYYKNIVEAIDNNKAYNIEEIFLIQDCEDTIHIEKVENYKPHTCSCGVKWSIKYKGTLDIILSQIEQDMLDFIYSR